jgi:aspartyl-tRNA(Asn)/glutamyl-tRNA(Gln) amidotransferase subunit B
VRHEAERQVAVLESGGTIVMETRHWDEERGVTRTLRRKESVTDYRYFPDPDLVELVTTTATVEAVRQELPELPAAARTRLREAGVPVATAAAIVANDLLVLLDAASAAGAPVAAAATWIAGEVTGQLGAAGLDLADSGLTGAHVAELVAMIEDARLSSTMAKQVLAGVIESRGAEGPAAFAEGRGLVQMSDATELGAIVARVVASDPDSVAAVRAGNDRAIGALVGRVMRETGGAADPRLTNELLRAAIAED